jgi:RNase adapter protein RapZ
MEIVIVTGISGAGKTEASKALEDLGFYTIDNMPASLLLNIAELARQGKKFDRVALVMDVRGGSFEDLFSALDSLNAEGLPYTIVFLDASNDVLVRRFSQTRRIHPLGDESLRVSDMIKEERKLLDPVRERADIVVDTSLLNIYELRGALSEVLPDVPASKGLRMTIISFGYKYGLPLDADMIVDMRFLPNPYWVESLQNQCGLDKPVSDYVLNRPEAAQFIDGFVDLINNTLPRFEDERKMHITIGVGCTGGHHRSVAVAEELARRFKEGGNYVGVTHRDLDKR